MLFSDNLSIIACFINLRKSSVCSPRSSLLIEVQTCKFQRTKFFQKRDSRLHSPADLIVAADHRLSTNPFRQISQFFPAVLCWQSQ